MILFFAEFFPDMTGKTKINTNVQLVSMQVPTTVLTGPPGVGKTTILKLLTLITESDPHFLIADTSRIIGWHRERQTEFGREFDRLAHRQEGGKLLPARLIVESTIQYLSHHNKLIPVYHFFVMGGVRDEEQAGLVKARFKDIGLVHIHASLSEAEDGRNARFGKEDRLDGDSPEVFRDRYQDYETYTIPGVSLFESGDPKRAVLRLKKAERMASKMDSIIKFVNVREGVRSAWLHRCRDRKHTTYQSITTLDEDARLRKQAQASVQNGSPAQTTPMQNSIRVSVHSESVSA